MDEEKAVKNALRYIRAKPELVAFVRDFDELAYFTLSTDLRFREICDANGDNHSGSSLEWCLRCCQRQLQNVLVRG